MNRTVRLPLSVRCSWAAAIAARTSATPDMTADSVVNSAPIASARMRARVVLPVPGGPHSRSESRWPRATDLPERPSLADEVLLADELVERPRAHPRGERLPLRRRLEERLGTGAVRRDSSGWARRDRTATPSAAAIVSPARSG